MKIILLGLTLLTNCLWAMSDAEILASFRTQIEEHNQNVTEHELREPIYNTIPEDVILHKLVKITQDEEPQDHQASTLAMITDLDNNPIRIICYVEGDNARIKEVDEEDYEDYNKYKDSKRKKRRKHKAYERQYWSVEQLGGELLLKKKDKYKIFRVKAVGGLTPNSDDMTLILTYLYNGAKKTYRSVKVDLMLEDDQWVVKNGDNERITDMHMIVNYYSFLDIKVGIKRIVINEDAQTIRNILVKGDDYKETKEDDDNGDDEDAIKDINEIPYLKTIEK